jgi:tetratricopeptide (TPR) repeat protein
VSRRSLNVVCPGSWWQLSVLLLAGMAAAQVPNSSQNAQLPGSPPADIATPGDGSQASAPPTSKIKKEVVITAPRVEQPLPTLPPDEFNDCINRLGHGALDPIQVSHCELQIRLEKKIVIEACTNRSGHTEPPRAIQACTELLDRKALDRHERFLVLAHRAAAYLAQSDMQHALDDYNEAVRLAPHKAYLYQNRGVVYASRSDNAAALRDLDTAIRIDSKDVDAFRQRAKIYQALGNFTYARADYSEAIGLQPRNAALWSERGYACLGQHDYEGAVKDETQAIQLDPKLARAYFFRGAAFGGLGDSHNSLSDLVAAVRLDPSLGRYVVFKGEDASLTLPPL